MEWFLNNLWSLWLITMFIFLVIEMLSLDLIFLMLAGASVVGLVSQLLGAPFWLQVTIFAIAGLLMIFVVRPIALKHLHRGPRDQLSNVDRLLGSKALVLEPTNAEGGLIKIGGDTWSARTTGGTVEPDQQVYVHRIDGATAVVAVEAPQHLHTSRPNPAGL